MKTIIFFILGVLYFIIDHFAYKNLRDEYKNISLIRYSALLGEKYYTPKGWKFKVTTYIIFFILVIVVFFVDF